MDSKISFYMAWVFYLLVSSCSPEKPLDQNKIKQELAQRELKRISKTELYEKAKILGDSLSSIIQTRLFQNLSLAITEKGVEGAVSFCSIKAIELTSSEDQYPEVEIARVSAKFRNPYDEPDSIESLVLDAYTYSHENNLPLEPAVMDYNENLILYTKPILIASTLCLQCHGEAGKEISLSTSDTLNRLYPNDLAVNYKVGDLRGMWSIQIPIKTLVNF